MLKKLPAVFIGLLLALSAYAAKVELSAHHPDTYTVRKGDTLWSIAAHFLQGPWQWPEVWQANPQVRNPHLIYPGDVINLVYVDGQPRLTLSSTSSTESSFGPHVRETQLEDAIKPIPLSAIADFLKRPRMINEDDFKHAAHVIAIEDSHLRGAPGQLIYVRGLDAQPGQQFAVLRPLSRYYEMTSKDAGQPNSIHRQSLDNSDDSRPAMLWHHGPEDFTLRGNVHFLGYEMLQFATLEVTHTGKVTSTLALTADFEIRPGDFVLPLDTMQYDSQYVPHSPRQVPANMHVLAFADSLNSAGPLQVIALSHGSEDGVENGQVYSVFHQNDSVHDELDYPELSTKAFLHRDDAEVQLPEEYIGHVMVFRTFDHVCYGLIMDGIRPVHIDDHLYEPDHR